MFEVPRRCLALIAACALVVGCGGDDDTERVVGMPDPEHVREVERNPYAITCGDLRRQRFRSENQRLVIHAEFALAKDPALKKVVAKETRNRTGRSVYYAMTVICKGKSPSFEPARPAIEAVSRGKYLAARNRPG
jgi:hypothetical protein